MAEVDQKEFDPYYKWLAIPPQEQPPNSYRLLGVTLFEDDPEVIAAAADRQMAHIKSFAAGRHASHSQRLLNELSKARVCLLNAEQKARYDVRLRDEFEAESLDESFETYFSQESNGAPSATAAATSIHHLAPPPLPAAPSLIVVRRRQRQQTRRPWIPLVLLLCAVVAGVGAFQTLRSPGNNTSSQPFKDKTEPRERRQLPRQELPEVEPKAPIPEPPVPLPMPELPPQNRPATLPEANRRQDVHLPMAPSAIKADVVIDVDLSKPRQRVAVSHDSFLILSLRLGDDVTDMSQPLSRSVSARIDVNSAASVTLNLDVEQSAAGVFVFVTPLITVDNKELPFTLPYLDRSKRNLTNDLERIGKAIAALEKELRNVTIFIESPMVKALEALRNAKTTKLQIEQALPPLRNQLGRIDAQLQVLNRLIELAGAIDVDCVVELVNCD